MKKIVIIFIGAVVFFGMVNSASAEVNWDPIQTINIPANTITPTTSSVLVNGAKYKITVSGTFFAGDNIEADAKYSFRTGSSSSWTDLVSTYESYGETLLDLFMDSDNDWGGYNSEHVYSKIITGSGNVLNFHIYDIYPSNNTGGLTVQIDRLRREATISSPDEGEKVYGEITFEAFLVDDDQDNIQWAIRKGTCATGTGTVFGNVDGYSNVATIDTSNLTNQTFSFVGDMSNMLLGMYCFVYNPVEDNGESNIRETMQFELVEPLIVGPPTDMNQCKKDGWKTFNNPVFKNQGDCVSYVQSNKKAIGNRKDN